ncbi:hypothetical protein AvCA_17490 [Azotobacter vinelandii CA]|uniref:DUF2243 domain-containing protein n=2 Tax=Azotobacter vinelandii TaxID=354 RepID=C1DSK7_AZOVD|nr:DUF2243 domain-containing protein [Azotobacter vinelandii]ACO77962.1 conserved hypothetical protein [Azotobacter vinelandii DJ]AGK16919.1 hypothetical protein AvCA_17490 [Azotobacter vinelandii CA]AGK20126.1 hypothetical protein AvCA6_17490 [Azotobacter vinelandii CA6]WKN23691.1 DUF2243 domain-containing protein [Azotobacter vinelandii]SFY21456.1 Uncharacterized membrane protein [Azotobacter vinelandii]
MSVPLQTDIHRSMLASVLIGIGLMAGVDEIIFHQLLGWHHFYDLATPKIALFSDGLLHSAELIVLVAGFFMLIDLRGRRALASTAAWAGLFIGLGGFQLFDGIVDHKVLRLHQIRYGIDNLLTYDLVWNASGAALLLIGLLLGRPRAGGRPG